MIQIDPSVFQYAISAQQTARDLTTQELTNLKTEFTADPEHRYNSSTDPATLVSLSAQTYQVPNTNPQSTIQRTDTVLRSTIYDDLYYTMTPSPGVSVITALIAAQRDSANPMGTMAQEVLTTLQTTGYFDFADAMVYASMVALGLALIGAGLMTQAQVDAILRIPDPSWTEQITKPSRVDAVLGTTNGVLDVRDVEKVLAS